MTAYIGLLKYKESPRRSGEEELATGRVARAIAEIENHGARFLSILWSDGDYDMVLTLESKDEAVAAAIFAKLGAQENATIAVSPALVDWEKRLSVQGKSY